MTLIKNFKLPRGILASQQQQQQQGWLSAMAATPNKRQAEMKRIKKFISTFIVTLVERDLLRSYREETTKEREKKKKKERGERR